MLDHIVNIIKHVRPELAIKWIAAGVAGMLCAITYDYATKGDNIFFEDGEYDWLVNCANNTSEEELYAVGQGEPYLKLKLKE